MALILLLVTLSVFGDIAKLIPSEMAVICCRDSQGKDFPEPGKIALFKKRSYICGTQQRNIYYSCCNENWQFCKEAGLCPSWNSTLTWAISCLLPPCQWVVAWTESPRIYCICHIAAAGGKILATFFVFICVILRPLFHIKHFQEEILIFGLGRHYLFSETVSGHFEAINGSAIHDELDYFVRKAGKKESDNQQIITIDSGHLFPELCDNAITIVV